jgi:transcriptional regulator NrdR family protein
MIHIVKRKGHKEEFDTKKLYASIFSACMSLRIYETEAELLAQTVLNEVIASLVNKESIDSKELSKLVAQSLEKYNPDVSYMYSTHKDLY